MENTETQTGLEKMDFKTADGVDANIEKLAQIFPEAVTETKDANGKLVRVANLEALKALLEGKVADPNEQECYEFIWPGKSDAIIEAAKSITKTLRPCPEESKNWDSTQNLYIEGDNLEALKLLQQSYLGKVKMIYIDPPYNTGKDFVYRDNFHKSKSEYDEESTVRDEDDNKLVQNTESNGRFHSDWCSMIYPRLKLARDLLSDDGVIFISIDDNEVHNLRKICDEIFGEKNFITELVWEKKKKGSFLANKITNVKEYLIVYGKDIVSFKGLIGEINTKVETYPCINAINKREIRTIPAGISSKYKDSNFVLTKGSEISDTTMNILLHSDLVIKDGKLAEDVILEGNWRYSQSAMKEYAEKGELYITRDLYLRRIVSDPRIKPLKDLLSRIGDISELSSSSDININNLQESGWGSNEDADEELRLLLGIQKLFDYPKPVRLIFKLIASLRDANSIILDFFSGSATTAHACMQLNAEDGGNRKFIMVQLPEKTDEKSEAFKAGYKNICEIGKERIRRAGEKIKAEHATTAPNLDIGFRVLKVAESNMKDVYYSPAQTSQDLLDSLESNIKEDRTDLDLLFACLIDFGVELSLPLKSETIDGVSVHTVQSGEIPDIIACFAENIPESVVREIASRKPLRAVFRDSSFKDSPSKINVKEIFKYHSPNTTIKVL